MNILITGCAGYIGSVCAYRFLKEGYRVYGFDNLSRGHIETIEKLKKYGDFIFLEGDLKKFSEINSVFKNNIDAIIHFAAYSQVAESEINPVKYYENNVTGSINLSRAMIENNVKNIVFSSTASIYGNPIEIPIKENHPKNPVNTYGLTKLITENILDDISEKYNINCAKLRYFNVTGASDNLEFGELHTPETHLIPNILNMENLKIYGLDYNTKDKSAIRDYIDVEDLIDAHLSSLKYIQKENKSIALNLGSKTGYSVLEIVDICKRILKKDIKFEILKRRKGDCEILVADNSSAKEILNWQPNRTLEESIKKAYQFMTLNI